MNLNLILVIGLGLLNSQVFGKPQPGLSPPDTIDDISSHQAMQSCGDLDDTCIGCLSLGNCKFATFGNSETLCVDVTELDEEIGKMKPNSTLEDVMLSEEKCPSTEDDGSGTQIPPKFSTSLAPENQTTTSTSSSPSTSATSTSTTTVSTTTSTTTESTTPSTTSTPKPTTSTSTTTEKTSPVTTASPIISTTPVDPSGKSGSKFDGWSFFGGILLTIGLSAIGFVSFKYYKVRSGGSHAGTNYNRF